MILTYKYRLKDKSAVKRLRAQAVACNQVWNWCVATQRETERRWKAGKAFVRWLSQYDLQSLAKGSSKELGIHAQTVQCICERFVAARDKNRGAPDWRRSFGVRASRGFIPFQRQSRQINGNSIIYLGKRIRWFGNKRRPLPESAKGGAFVEDSLGRWWVTFHVEVAERRPSGDGAIGIDLGLKSLATFSDGRKIDAPQIYRRMEVKLATAQRANNKRRAKAIHIKIANVRNDFLHNISTTLADQNAIIAVGDVNSKQLAKTRMAKSVLDAGWSTFRSMLKYKSAGYVEVDEKFTTQLCSDCGVIGGPKGIAQLGVRQWQCLACGVSHDRDVNSALNILAIARRSAAPLAEESRRVA